MSDELIRWLCLGCHVSGAVPASLGTYIYDQIVTDHNRAVGRGTHMIVVVSEVPRRYPTLNAR